MGSHNIYAGHKANRYVRPSLCTTIRTKKKDRETGGHREAKEKANISSVPNGSRYATQAVIRKPRMHINENLCSQSVSAIHTADQLLGRCKCIWAIDRKRLREAEHSFCNAFL